MSRAAIALGLLLLALATAAGGYWQGQRDGQAASVARQDAQTVQDLSAQLTAHADLIKQSGAASRRLRQSLAQREQADQQTTKELRHALATTADSRTGCVFPAGVMRSLADAQTRAAQAAASGIGRALPTTDTSPTGQR
ncbi:hypothetical protein [Giesbergeria anulus]|uniref:Phage lysis regulatory protein, LysB family n=1 Tax=Giesbergeria anulus TaxID=180197 RepID=A0A1H9JFL4_9BURK|nr:hypothetical protein [Giesbergeria anulus]SEQ85620.1 hypothetical protein SAMN02982919_01384 [Giesbergeria anulus]